MGDVHKVGRGWGRRACAGHTPAAGRAVGFGPPHDPARYAHNPTTRIGNRSSPWPVGTVAVPQCENLAEGLLPMLIQWFRGTATPALLCADAGVCGAAVLQDARLNRVRNGSRRHRQGVGWGGRVCGAGLDCVELGARLCLRVVATPRCCLAPLACICSLRRGPCPAPAPSAPCASSSSGASRRPSMTLTRWRRSRRRRSRCVRANGGGCGEQAWPTGVGGAFSGLTPDAAHDFMRKTSLSAPAALG